MTPAQTKLELVWIIGNLGRDKLANRGGGVLHCAVKNEISLGNWREKLKFVQFSPELRAVLSVLLHFVQFLLQVPNHTLIVGNLPGKDENEMMNIWISYIWTAELKKKKKKDEENMIIAIKDATLRKESLKNLGSAGIWLELLFLWGEIEKQVRITLIGRLHPPLPDFSMSLYLALLGLKTDCEVSSGPGLQQGATVMKGQQQDRAGCRYELYDKTI